MSEQANQLIVTLESSVEAREITNILMAIKGIRAVEKRPDEDALEKTHKLLYEIHVALRDLGKIV